MKTLRTYLASVHDESPKDNKTTADPTTGAALKARKAKRTSPVPSRPAASNGAASFLAESPTPTSSPRSY